MYKEGNTYWLAMGDGIILGPKGKLFFGTRKGVKSLSLDNNGSYDKSLKPYLPYDGISSYYVSRNTS